MTLLLHDFQLSMVEDSLIWSWNEVNGQISAKFAYDAVNYALLNVQ